MKLNVQITLWYNTDGFIDPDDLAGAKHYLENCEYVRKLDDNMIEYMDVTVLGVLDEG